MKRNRSSKSRPLFSLVILLTLASLFIPACGDEQPEKFTIGVVSLLPTMDSVFEGFKSGMAELGYTEGENITYVYAGATGSVDALESTAQALVKADVDLILSVTTPGTLAAQQATAGTDIAVIFVAVTDPIAAGLVQDLTRPGGNVTGVLSAAKGAANEGRRLQLLLQAAPGAKRIYVPYNPDDPAVMMGLGPVSDAASQLGVELVLRETRSVDEATVAAQTIPDDVDAVFTFSDRVVVSIFQEFTEAAQEKRLPLSTSNPDGVKIGAMISYGSDFFASGKQAARLVDQVFQGESVSGLPVEQPEFFLTINLQVAQAIGLEIPDTILRQANEVIR